MHRIALGLLIATASLFNAHSASFDGSKASTAVEGSICANPTLSALDEQLAAAYQQATNASPNPAALLDAQRPWLKNLNACGANAHCLTSTYEQRIAVLNAASSQPLAPSPQQVTPTQTTAAPLFPTPPQQNQTATQSTLATNTGRGRIGVQIGEVTKEVAESLGLGKASGALVRAVEDGSPAASAGVDPEDIITRFDGKPVERSTDLPRLVGGTKPGSMSTLQVFRRGATRDLTVTVAEIEPERKGRAAAPDNQPKIQTVVVEGVGIDVQGAAQNAAQNALTNVVGSLIDTTNMVEKRTQITDGIRAQTKNITSSIKEYSQGSIQSFEIVDTKKESGLFRVTAKVSIRIEDFRAYIKKLAEGETAVSSGLFTQAQSMTNQKKNKINLLNDLLRPLIGGEVVQFAVQPPIPLANSKYKGGDDRLDFIIKKNGEEYVFLVKVIASLDRNFLTNMKKVVQETAAAHVSVPQTQVNYDTGFHCEKFNGDFNPKLAVSIGFLDIGFNRRGRSYEDGGWIIDPSKYIDLYMIDGIGKALLTSQHEDEKARTSLEIAILGENGSVLQKEQIYHNGDRRGPSATERIALYPDDFLDVNDLPWKMVGTNIGFCRFTGIRIVARRTFTLGIAITPAAMKDAQKIVVRIIN